MQNYQVISEFKSDVSKKFNDIWFVIFEPLLFTSIGNEIKFQELDPKIIGIVYFMDLKYLKKKKVKK